MSYPRYLNGRPELIRAYCSWQAAKSRCLNKHASGYNLYGGRGIAICERWITFENFLADMGPRPEGTSLDRFPNVDGNYEPGNCRWATASDQQRNKKQRTHCRHGHEFTKENTKWVTGKTKAGATSKYRCCVICKRAKGMRRHWRHRDRLLSEHRAYHQRTKPERLKVMRRYKETHRRAA